MTAPAAVKLQPGHRVLTPQGPGVLHSLGTLPGVWPEKQLAVAYVQLDGRDHRTVFLVRELQPLEREPAGSADGGS